MLFRKAELDTTGPGRPSHWHEDPNQRTDLNEATLDYPDTDTQPDAVEDYGFPDAPESVPVYLTQAPPNDRTLTDWSAGTLTVDTVNPAQIGSAADRGRRRIVIRNLDAANFVTAFRGSTDQGFAGYRIPAGESAEFEHNHSIWLRADTADVTVSFFTEFDVLELNEHG